MAGSLNTAISQIQPNKHVASITFSSRDVTWDSLGTLGSRLSTLDFSLGSMIAVDYDN